MILAVNIFRRRIFTKVVNHKINPRVGETYNPVLVTHYQGENVQYGYQPFI